MDPKTNWILSQLVFGSEFQGCLGPLRTYSGALIGFEVEKSKY